MSLYKNGVDSTLNEADNEMGKVLLTTMQIADTRKDATGECLWNSDRVFMTTTTDMEEIFASYQLQHDETNVSFPFLAYSPDKAYVAVDHTLANRVTTAAVVLSTDKHVTEPKQISSIIKNYQSKYSVTIWDDDFKSIRYYQNNLALRCIHREYCHTWNSPILDGFELSFTYLLGLPVINTIPSNSDKIKGKGYIYALGFDVDIWGAIADVPTEESLIYQVTTGFNNEGKEGDPVKSWQKSVTGDIK